MVRFMIGTFTRSHRKMFISHPSCALHSTMTPQSDGTDLSNGPLNAAQPVIRRVPIISTPRRVPLLCVFQEAIDSIKGLRRECCRWEHLAAASRANTVRYDVTLVNQRRARGGGRCAARAFCVSCRAARRGNGGPGARGRVDAPDVAKWAVVRLQARYWGYHGRACVLLQRHDTQWHREQRATHRSAHAATGRKKKSRDILVVQMMREKAREAMKTWRTVNFSSVKCCAGLLAVESMKAVLLYYFNKEKFRS